MGTSEPLSPRPRHRYFCLDETAAGTGLSKTSVTNAGAFSSIAQTQSSLLYLTTATGRERSSSFPEFSNWM